MASVNYNLKLDEELKAKSFGVIESFGLTPAQAIRLLLKQIADTESIPISFERRTPENESLQFSQNTLESIKQMQNGEFKTLDMDNLVKEYE